jgi:predicted DNA-binding transcriptional regulator AlpA
MLAMTFRPRNYDVESAGIINGLYRYKARLKLFFQFVCVHSINSYRRELLKQGVPMQNLTIGVYITAADASASLGMTENALAKMRLSGEGPPFVKIGRRVRYCQSDLQVWLAARRYSSTAAVTASVSKPQ